MTASRSDISSASSWSWVTKTNVMPTSRCSEVSSERSDVRSLASSAPSGSSSSSTRGSRTSARARATRCCCPPDSWCGLRSRELVEPDEGERLGGRAAPCSSLDEVAAPPQAVRDVALDVEVREQRVALEHRVDRTLVGRRVRHVDAVEQDLPDVGGSKPAIIRSVVVFPQPDGPSRLKNSPARDVQVDAVDGDVLAELAPQGDQLDPPAACWRTAVDHDGSVGRGGPETEELID